MGTQVCRRCDKRKPLSDFPVNHLNKNGHSRQCKACTRAWNRAYYRRRKAEGPAPGVTAKTCTACGETKSVEFYIVRPMTRDGYSNRCSGCESLYVAAYWKTPNGKRLAAQIAARYRAKKNGVNFEPVSHEDVWERDQGHCYLCDKKIRSLKEANFDHIIPISRGGAHTFENLAATHARCNQRKNDKLPEELTWAIHVRPVSLQALQLA